MAKKSTSYELSLPDLNPHAPAYQWLYESLRSEILQGRLRPGMRLPATRDLARQYGLARGTIVNAFDLLGSEGYEPLTRGMAAALPHVDDFRAAHNLQALDDLGRLLASLDGRSRAR